MLKAEIEETKKRRWMKKAAPAFCFFPLKMLETSPQMAGMLTPLDAQTCSPHTPGGWHLYRRCCKVRLAPVDCKASRVSGGPSSSLLPIFMTPLYWTTPPHPSCLNFVYTFVLRACHWGHTSELRKVLRHFFFLAKSGLGIQFHIHWQTEAVTAVAIWSTYQPSVALCYTSRSTAKRGDREQPRNLKRQHHFQQHGWT